MKTLRRAGRRELLAVPISRGGLTVARRRLAPHPGERPRACLPFARTGGQYQRNQHIACSRRRREQPSQPSHAQTDRVVFTPYNRCDLNGVSRDSIALRARAVRANHTTSRFPHTLAMTTPSTDSFNPFQDTPGNILFGGLPLRCGPEAAIHHLERVGDLGMQIEGRPAFVSRTVAEVKEDAELRTSASTLVIDAIANLRVSAEDIRRGKPEAFSERLLERLVDSSVDDAWEFGFILKHDRNEALSALARYFWLSEAHDVATLIQLTPSADRRRWSLPTQWSDEFLTRARSVTPHRLLLGLHELDRLPWSQHGGLVAGRGASDQYLRALKAINEHVISAYITHEWYFGLDEQVRWMIEAKRDLMRLSVPFDLKGNIGPLLFAVSRLYMQQEFAAATIVARSALEACANIACTALSIEPYGDLATRLRALERKSVLTHAAALAAREVRVRGNEAVHNHHIGLDKRRIALEVVQELVTVIHCLKPVIQSD